MSCVHLLRIICALLAMANINSAFAQNGAQIMQDFFGNVLNEVQRQQQLQQQQQQQQQLYQQLIPLWQSCNAGEISACDQALQFPLNPQTRAQLVQMRVNAVQRQIFLTNWQNCFSNDNLSACAVALNYPAINGADRSALVTKQDNIRYEIEQQRQAQLREELERRDRIAREQEEKRQEAIRAETLRREQIREQNRLAHLKAMEDARISCKKRDEFACRRGIAIAADNDEKTEFVHLLDVAQSPLGLTFLKPLKDIPISTFIAGAIAAALGAALLLLQFRRGNFAPSKQMPDAPVGPKPENALQSKPESVSPTAAPRTEPIFNGDVKPIVSIDSAKTVSLMRQIGSGGIVVSLCWWAIFYAEVVRQTGGSMKDFHHAFSCILYTPGVCAVIKGVASVAGYWPYEPFYLWISVALLAAGHLIPITAETGKR